MKILGLPVPFTGEKQKALSTVDPGGGGWFRVLESFAGAWQHNVTVDYDSVISNPAIFACQTLIASDIAKLRVKLVQRNEDGIWLETDNTNFNVLIKPNHFQTRIQFFETWMISKLQNGNTYVLKRRDVRGNVVALYVLDPRRVRTMIADNGDVFYELQDDKLPGLGERAVAPAREIIHDRFNCFWHPLVGVSPIFAAGLSGTLGLAIKKQATKFFENGARPGGVLTAPGAISDATATRLKEYWDSNFSGEKAGKVAVLGDGLKYEQMSAKATDSQLAEQWRLTTEAICGVYHVPMFMIGAAEPNYNNVQNLTLRYYSQCLQTHIESIESLLDEGLGLRGELGAGRNLGTEFDLDGLLRMDSATLLEMLEKAKSVMTLDERRRRLDMPRLPTGGDTVYLQQQDHSIEAIAARDAQLIDMVENPPAPQPEPANDNELADQANAALVEIYKGLR